VRLSGPKLDQDPAYNSFINLHFTES
jgi:hypothetical protein